MPRVLFGLLLVAVAGSVIAEDDPSEDASAAANLAERYWKIVRKRPTRGTAFDLWYRHALDAGKLDNLVKRVEAEASQAPDDPAAQLLVGLVHERRGHDTEA